MKLYYSDVLSPYKTCAVAKYLKLPIEFIYVDLHKGEHHTAEYLAINPNGKVPTLICDDNQSLWEADAILCKLAQAAGSNLWPHDSSQQLEIIRWFSWGAHHFYRTGGDLYFEYIIKPRFNIGSADAKACEDHQQEFCRLAAILNAHLKGRKWLLGDDLSVADFSVAVPLAYADAAHMPLNEFPEVKRWHNQLNELEAWRDPFPVKHSAAT